MAIIIAINDYNGTSLSEGRACPILLYFWDKMRLKQFIFLHERYFVLNVLSLVCYDGFVLEPIFANSPASKKF